MVNAYSELSVFNKLDEETVLKLVEFFDESMLFTPPKKSELGKIIGKDLKSDDVEKIIVSFYNFIASKDKSEEIFNVIDNAGLEQDKKTLLKTAIQKIHDKVDSVKISAGVRSGFLQQFGFPHTHGFAIVTEFRPVTDSDKIIKLIPSMIVSIKIHNSDKNEDSIVNFQVNLEETKQFIKVLEKGAESLKTEIQEMRSKFGDEIID